MLSNELIGPLHSQSKVLDHPTVAQVVTKISHCFMETESYLRFRL
jgi:hypothetical protein